MGAGQKGDTRDPRGSEVSSCGRLVERKSYLRRGLGRTGDVKDGIHTWVQGGGDLPFDTVLAGWTEAGKEL